MAIKKSSAPRPNNTTIRHWMLKYFFDRNTNATSVKGKKGSAVKISFVKKELKANHDLTQQEVQSNLTYLLSQGWIVDNPEEKRFPGKRGTMIPSITSYYQITAAGIDKIEGPGEFTMSKFHGIRIEATGQNIITVGDGNQIDAKYGHIGEALAELRKAITDSDAPESDKLDYIADIDTIQSQLAKGSPTKAIISGAWNAVKGAASINGCTALVTKIGAWIASLL